MSEETIPYHFITQNLSEQYNENGTESIMHISSIRKKNSVLNPILFLAFGVLSNTLALIVLKRSPSDQKRKLFIRLVAGLAITDLVGSITTGPVVISVYLNNFRWIGGTAVCKYSAFMMMFFGIATTTIVCMMAIERLICIRLPYLYYASLWKKHATICLCSAWTFAGLIAGLPLIGFGEIVLQYPYTWCFFNYYTEDPAHQGFNFLYAIVVLLTFLVTITCNCIVLITLFHTNMRGISHQTRRESRTHLGYSRRYAECQMAVLLIGITILFSSCYLPLMTRILIIQTKLLHVNVQTDLLLFRFAALNQILNPWVYILLRREVVWKMASSMKKILSKQSKENERNEFRRRQNSSASAILKYGVNYSCCTFCWHCMCDPPQTYRSSSASLYSDRRRNHICSSTQQLDIESLMRNRTIHDNNEEKIIFDDSRPQITSQLIKQASIDTDVIIQQPTTYRDTRVKFNMNGSLSFEPLESHSLNILDNIEVCKAPAGY